MRKFMLVLQGHLAYAFKKQLPAAIILLGIWLASSLISTINNGFYFALPNVIASLIILNVAFAFSLFLFCIFYIPKLIYVMKAKKPKLWAIRVLSMLPEYSKWYILLLFVINVFYLTGIYYTREYGLQFVRPISLVLGVFFGFFYKK